MGTVACNFNPLNTRQRAFGLNTELTYTLSKIYKARFQKAEDSVEYWLVRDTQSLFGYTEWRNFTAAITKANTAPAK